MATLDKTKPTVSVVKNVSADPRQILSVASLEFLGELHARFEARRRALLEHRKGIQKQLDEGWLPEFRPETASIRTSAWRVAPVPAELLDRRVEITGPVDRKMVINALNSGARVFMADFEDSNAATWQNCFQGQENLFDAVRRTISYKDAGTGKEYALKDDPAILFVRPRGLHLVEKHLRFKGQPASASLVDFGLYFFHNAFELIAGGTAPYFYLPKLESYEEARLWQDVFVFAQEYLDIPRGTIKATVLIETILAAFQMDEILYELRDHSAGLNCGRWDYIFSFIKKFRNRPEFILPDRAQVTMTVPNMRAYVNLLIQTCHKRGAHAMGGMAAQIPIKNNPALNLEALAKVAADKEREALAGHDGTWVAHPGLIPTALEQFDKYMPGPNQLHVTRQDVTVLPEDLLKVPTGTITEAGIRSNMDVAIQYLEAWLRGNGCVPIHNLMEDAATAEICRAQLWQWLKYGVTLADGRPFSLELYHPLLDEVTQNLRQEMGELNYAKGRFPEAIHLFHQLVTAPHFEEFLTLPAYDLVD